MCRGVGGGGPYVLVGYTFHTYTRTCIYTLFEKTASCLILSMGLLLFRSIILRVVVDEYRSKPKYFQIGTYRFCETIAAPS